MSRLTRLWTRFCLKASLLRTYAETLVLFVVLSLFTAGVYQARAGAMTVTSLTFFIIPCMALYYSLRLRIPDGRWYRRIGVDLLCLVPPALLFNLLVWQGARLSVVASRDANISTVGFEVLFTTLLAFPYLFFRAAIRFIVGWNYLRQRRIIWSLVTGNLLAAALLQALVAAPLMALFFTNLGDNAAFLESDTPLANWLYRLQMSLPMIGVVMLLATAVLFALLPVSIAVSYFFARGIRHRLDVLLDAAHAASDGNYETQIPVSGQDEVARLQVDFNIMTANLKVNIDELRDEREKVTTLLKNRRELMANVSHELRTPVATVRAYLESALGQQAEQNDVTISQHDVTVILRETVRLQTLVDDLFAISQAEVDQLAVKLRPVNGIHIIQRVIETVAPLAWRINRVEIVAGIPAWLPDIVVDEARLEQVLRNLIHNSLRYTPPGGLIIIRASEHSGTAEIQVQDTGSGIDPEHLPHIWERYYRDAENGGTGLGLALVKSFIEAMHGQVMVSSTPGEGTCFTLQLPLVTSAPEKDAPLPQPQPVLRTVSTQLPVQPSGS